MPDAMLFEEGIITVKIDINVFFLLIDIISIRCNFKFQKPYGVRYEVESAPLKKCLLFVLSIECLVAQRLY